MTKGIERWILAQQAGMIENLLHQMLITESGHFSTKLFGLARSCTLIWGTKFRQPVNSAAKVLITSKVADILKDYI